METNIAEKLYNFKGENLLVIYVHNIKSLGIECIWMQKAEDMNKKHNLSTGRLFWHIYC